MPPIGETSGDSVSGTAEGTPDGRRVRSGEQSEERVEAESASMPPEAAAPAPSRFGISQGTDEVGEMSGRSAIRDRSSPERTLFPENTEFPRDDGRGTSNNLERVGMFERPLLGVGIDEMNTQKDARETDDRSEMVQIEGSLERTEHSSLDRLAIENLPERTSSSMEPSSPARDLGGESGEFLKVAEKLKDLESELKVDMLSQFEAFVRSKARRAGDTSVSQGGSKPGGDVLLVAKSDSACVVGGRIGVDNVSTDTDGGSSGNDDLQMAISLAVARKKELLAEHGARTEAGGESSSWQRESSTASARIDCGGKRTRPPEREEIDQGAPKCARIESPLPDPDRTVVDTVPVTGAADEASDSMVREGGRTGQEAGEEVNLPAGAGEGEEQEMVDADRAVVTCNYSFTEDPVLLATAKDEFLAEKNNFLKGCKWAPDGTCILTNSDDGVLRLFNLPTEFYSPQTWAPGPDLKAVLDMVEGELVYDYCWYPCMTSLSPETCCFASTSRGHPVHMWDAFTGQLRCSYRPHDHMDELITPHSLGFSLDGTKLYCGCNKLINVFDTTRPGKECEAKQTKGKLGGQTGIISCFAMSPDGASYAAGSYSRTIGIYADYCPSAITVLHGQSSGVTHLMYSVDGTRIYSGGRKDNEILCWDVRRSNEVLFSLRRNVKTNQRIYFDIDREDHFLVSGNQDGSVTAWDLTRPCVPTVDSSHPVLEPFTKFMAHDDTTNGVSIHPWLPLLATASGQRVIHPPRTGGSDGESDAEDDSHERGKSADNSLRVWSLTGKAAEGLIT